MLDCVLVVFGRSLTATMPKKKHRVMHIARSVFWTCSTTTGFIAGPAFACVVHNTSFMWLGVSPRSELFDEFDNSEVQKETTGGFSSPHRIDPVSQL